MEDPRPPWVADALPHRVARARLGATGRTPVPSPREWGLDHSPSSADRFIAPRLLASTRRLLASTRRLLASTRWLLASTRWSLASTRRLLASVSLSSSSFAN